MSAAEQHQLASEKSPTVSNDLSQLSDEAIQATLSEYKQAQTEYAHLRYGELGKQAAEEFFRARDAMKAQQTTNSSVSFADLAEKNMASMAARWTQYAGREALASRQPTGSWVGLLRRLIQTLFSR